MAFPTTPTLDPLSRGDENPLANGTWSGPLSLTFEQLQLISNQIAGASDGVASGSWWSTSQFGPDCELGIPIPVIPTDHVTLHLRLTNPGAANITGYRIGYSVSAGTFNHYFIERITSSTSSVSLASGTDLTLVAGDQIGFQLIGSTLALWLKQGAGAWSQRVTANDANITDAGFLALRVDDTTVRLGAPFGGTVPTSLPAPIGTIFRPCLRVY